MNTNMLKPTKLLMVDDRGNEIELQGTIEFEQLDLDSSELDKYKNVLTTQLSMNINIDNVIKLTRKKFIKLLMSKGIQRNGANEIAKYVLNKKGKYIMFDLLMW